MINREKIIKFAFPALIVVVFLVWKPMFSKNTSNMEKRNKDGALQSALNLKNLKKMMSSKAHASQFSQYEQWARNPFYVKEKTISSQSSRYKIIGISWSEDNPSTLIGDEVYTVGDRFGDYSITNIQPQFIVISNGRKVIKLKLNEDLMEATKPNDQVKTAP